MYRYLLSHPEDATLRDEFNHAAAYLGIERARLGDDRLEVQMSLSPELEAIRVPALLLQPLVENAVKHGILARNARGAVNVRARTNADSLLVEVEDRMDGQVAPLSAAQRESGSGIALSTLRQRLQRGFGTGAFLTLTRTDTGTLATVGIPLVHLGQDLATSPMKNRVPQAGMLGEAGT